MPSMSDIAKKKQKEKMYKQSYWENTSKAASPYSGDFRAAHGNGAPTSSTAPAGGGMNAGGYAQIAKMGLDAKGVGGANDDSNAGGMAQGAVGGASTGFAVGGVWGAAVGAVAGGVMGAAGAAAKRKAKNKAIEGQKYAALAQIEQNKGQQLNQAISSMGQRMRLT